MIFLCCLNAAYASDINEDEISGKISKNKIKVRKNDKSKHEENEIED